MAVSMARVAMNKIYPGSIYARPALAPLMVGVGGRVGAAQENLNEMYKYTLEQLAISPFSVNSEAYIDRIRKEYGYVDNGAYDAMGTIGSVVGAGVGAMFGTGLVNWRGFRTDNYKFLNEITITDLKTNKLKTVKRLYENTITDPRTRKTRTVKTLFAPDSFRANPFEWTGQLSSKRQATSDAFRLDKQNIQFFKTNKNAINDYNKVVDVVKDASAQYKQLLKNSSEDTKKKLEALQKAYEDAKDITKKQKALKEIKALEQQLKKTDPDSLKAYNSISKSVENYGLTNDIINASEGLAYTQVGKSIIDTIRNQRIAEAFSNELLKQVYKGQKLTPMKLLGVTGKVIGAVGDVASLGINIAGAVQSTNSRDNLLYTVGAIGDSLAVIGDIVLLATGVSGLGGLIGGGLNLLGAITSGVSGALVGSRVGETVGHSLTQEGAKAQSLFAQNLYSSMTNRLLTTAGTVLTTTLTPVLLNYLSGKNYKTETGKLIGKGANVLVNNAWGNYARSALTMMATQGINTLTTSIDKFK